MPTSSDVELYKIITAAQTNFPTWFRFMLNFKDKEAKLAPNSEREGFALNDAQRVVYNEISRQQKINKKVRLAVVKARQQGISTFSRAYILYNAIVRRGIDILCVSPSEQDAMGFFSIVIDMCKSLRYYSDLSEKMFKISYNSTQLTIQFDERSKPSKITSRWARSSTEGRGFTYQGVYLTEIDKFDKWETFFASLVPALPDTENSFMLIESTANGHRALYDLCVKGTCKTIFIPWYKTKEYSTPPSEMPQYYVPSEEAKQLMEEHSLTLNQAHWFETKKRLMSECAFFHEYPTTRQQAFAVSATNAIYSADAIQAAIECGANTNLEEQCRDYPIICGIDFAYKKDKIAIAWRQGRALLMLQQFQPSGNASEIEMLVAYKIQTTLFYNQLPSIIYGDAGCMGVTLIDNIKKRFGIKTLQPVTFGQRACDNRYLNLRTEMYQRGTIWFNNGPVSISRNIPEEIVNLFKQELLLQEWIPNSLKVQMVPKEKFDHSPNLSDAFALTFAAPGSEVNSPAVSNVQRRASNSERIASAKASAHKLFGGW